MQFKKLIIAGGAMLSFTACGTTQQSQDFWKTVNDVATQVGNTSTQSAAPTQNEIVRGLKEALQQGTSKGAEKLSLTDGFFKDAAIKILMPSEAKNVEEKLRALGFGSLVDDAVLSFNRGAEKAAIKAKPIFIDAITQMSFNDAMGILKGGGNSATEYLKKTTTNQLTQAFKPIIQTSLNDVKATKYWSDIMTTYNKIPLVQPINTDLAGYVTQKSIDGIFLKIADEERTIRANPLQQASALLQKVFNYALKR